MFTENHFGILDWAMVAGTLLVSLLIGLYYAFKSKHSNEDLLVGGRKMKIFPVAASIMVTFVSAITILGFPAEVYAYGPQIFMAHIVSAIMFPISAYVLIPYFYNMKLTSINEYLEKRFNSIWVRWLASCAFIFQTTVLTGVILYAPSIALEAFLGFPMWLSIIGMGICGTIYTSIGGLKAVVWTDTFQFLMMITGMVAIVVRGIISCGGVANAFRIANEGGRLQFIDLTVDPLMRHNLWNFIIGYGFHSLMQPAVTQLQVQRYSSMPSVSHARKAMICSIPLKLMIMGLCLLTGISVYATYAKCDPIKLGMIKKVDQIVPYFVVHELGDVPGMIGLFTSCIFSAVLSSISSSLNSLAAVTWEDFLSKHSYFKHKSPKYQANVSRVVGASFGVLTMGLAFGAQNLGAIYSATLATVGATGGAIYGVFVLAMFVPFANHVGAIVGLIVGLLSMVGISTTKILLGKSSPTLPTSIDSCPAEFLEIFNATTQTPAILTTTIPTITSSTVVNPWESYERIFELSYLLYSLVAALITVIVGIVFSLLTMCCSKECRKRPLQEFVHPISQSLCQCCTTEEDDNYPVILSSGSIIHVDPGQLKPYANGWTKPDSKRRSFPSENHQNGKINKGYMSSEL